MSETRNGPKDTSARAEALRGRPPAEVKPPRVWRVQCSATSRVTGKRCGNWAMRGSTVCRVPCHGGSLPSVRKRAAINYALFLGLRGDPAAELERILTSAGDEKARAAAARACIELGVTELVPPEDKSLSAEEVAAVEDVVGRLLANA